MGHLWKFYRLKAATFPKRAHCGAASGHPQHVVDLPNCVAEPPPE